MKVARVFPRKTSLSPQDPDAYFGEPDLFTPKDYDEVHISVAFTWDLKRAEELKRAWENVAPVKVGGVAVDGEGKRGFKPGMYLRSGVVITSRGCPNTCPWCIIGGKPLRELPICDGNNIQDNNLLACSHGHLDKVFRMLSQQRAINFSGGLEAARITDEVVERIRGIRLMQMFLAFDHESRRRELIKAVQKLRVYFKRRHVRCFVLMGFGKDTVDKAEGRLREAWEIGALPFAMLYRGPDGLVPEPVREWRKLQKAWTRPASIKAIMQRNSSPRGVRNTSTGGLG